MKYYKLHSRLLTALIAVCAVACRSQTGAASQATATLAATVAVTVEEVTATVPVTVERVADTVTVTVEEVATTYSDLTLLTLEPLIFADVGLCRMPIVGFDAYMHAPGYVTINIYVNEIARAAMAEVNERVFPPGSVIVKEKLPPLASSENAEDAVTQSSDLGIMIKHQKGYNPEGGDWEFAFQENSTLYSRPDQMATCQSCHAAGQVPQEWIDKYKLSGIFLTLTARDSVFLTLPTQTNTAP